MDKAFMARAIELSVANVRSGSGGPFGTVIVKDGAVVAEAANQVRGRAGTHQLATARRAVALLTNICP